MYANGTGAAVEVAVQFVCSLHAFHPLRLLCGLHAIFFSPVPRFSGCKSSTILLLTWPSVLLLLRFTSVKNHIFMNMFCVGLTHSLLQFVSMIEMQCECISLPFCQRCISAEVNQNVIMVLQVAIHSVPQLSPTLMKTLWSASHSVAAMMTKAPITALEIRFQQQRTVTIGMSHTDDLLSHWVLSSL